MVGPSACVLLVKHLREPRGFTELGQLVQIPCQGFIGRTIPRHDQAISFEDWVPAYARLLVDAGRVVHAHDATVGAVASAVQGKHDCVAFDLGAMAEMGTLCEQNASHTCASPLSSRHATRCRTN